MKKVSLVGVIVGGIVDIVSTGILAIPLTIYIMVKFNLLHIPPILVQPAMAAAIHASLVLSIAQWLIGAVGSILGGYVAAWIAKHDELLNGVFSAFLCVALGVYGWLTVKAPVPSYEHLLGFVGSPARGLLGGWLRLTQKRS
jgi:hypothetical protein